MNQKVVKKRRLRISGLLFLLLVFYLIGYFIYYVFTMPLGNIIITGNVYLTDNDIISIAKLDKNATNISISESDIISSLSKSELIENVVVEKSILGNINITVTEVTVLFIDSSKNEVVFSNGKTSKAVDKYLGVATLINYTPNEVYDRLIEKFLLIDENIIRKISEIEYAPNIKNDIMLDEERFILKMNDQNTVHVNLPNFEKLNNYDKIYDEVMGIKGTLYLDTSNDGNIFEEYKEDGEENELPLDDEGNTEES